MAGKRKTWKNLYSILTKSVKYRGNWRSWAILRTVLCCHYITHQTVFPRLLVKCNCATSPELSLQRHSIIVVYTFLNSYINR